MKILWLVIGVVILLVSMPAALAKHGRMKLLSVRQVGDDYVGQTADVSLDIGKGKGRVFLETVPLTKLDTQLSTKFAKETACKYLNMDCSGLDFIYTIRADSSVIGGPSAGAALTLLTISLLEDAPIGSDVSVTGTINAGGFIGPVGGLRAKIEAARDANLTRVLIPAGEGTAKEGNDTINLIEYGKDLGLEVIEVFSLDEAILHLTGKRLRAIDDNLTIEPKYQQTMQTLAELLCNRTEMLQMDMAETISKEVPIREDILELELAAIDLYRRARNSYDEKQFYSSASFCFSANYKYGEISLRYENISAEVVFEMISSLQQRLAEAEADIEGRQISTVTDLQAYMVVKERLYETQHNIDEMLDDNVTMERKYNLLAFANERLDSASQWATFFGFPGKNINQTLSELAGLCSAKVSEAEDRYTYVTLFVPEAFLGRTYDEIEKAREDMNGEKYALCLFRASKISAEVNTMITTMTLGPEEVPELVERKLELARKTIAAEIREGSFPIVGYSYYEYAGALKSYDPFMAAMFSDYALELSSMGLNHAEKRAPKIMDVDPNYLFFFLEGMGLGMLLSLLAVRIHMKRQSKKPEK